MYAKCFIFFFFKSHFDLSYCYFYKLLQLNSAKLIGEIKK